MSLLVTITGLSILDHVLSGKNYHLTNPQINSIIIKYKLSNKAKRASRYLTMLKKNLEIFR